MSKNFDLEVQLSRRPYAWLFSQTPESVGRKKGRKEGDVSCDGLACGPIPRDAEEGLLRVWGSEGRAGEKSYTALNPHAAECLVRNNLSDDLKLTQEDSGKETFPGCLSARICLGCTRPSVHSPVPQPKSIFLN